MTAMTEPGPYDPDGEDEDADQSDYRNGWPPSA
jgi:hypothetical protein